MVARASVSEDTVFSEVGGPQWIRIAVMMFLLYGLCYTDIEACGLYHRMRFSVFGSLTGIGGYVWCC